MTPGKRLELGLADFAMAPFETVISLNNKKNLVDAIAVFAILIRKELLIPIFCGIFMAETLSVVIQVGYFKYTKRKYGEGRRILLMSPLHHHFQKKGIPEPKLVMRFYIVGIMLAVLTIVTLKLR
jgi:phospho-N-acetylmuramoyl-pentapeptide-transferase